jgi:hypothetical protein
VPWGVNCLQPALLLPHALLTMGSACFDVTALNQLGCSTRSLVSATALALAVSALTNT